MSADPISPARLDWFLKLRRVAIAGQCVVFIVGDRFSHGRLSFWPILAAAACQMVGERATRAWTRRSHVNPEYASFALMLADCLVLTGLLFGFGGDTAPLAVLFLVNISLSGFLLGPKLTWILFLVSVTCFAAVFLTAHEIETDPIEWQLREMWVAFSVAAGLLVYFLQQTHRMLQKQRLAMEDAARALQQKEKLASLATLAAGAAHELGTPLSTIAVVSKELERGLEQIAAPTHALSDARLIRREVERCRLILGQMATDAGGSLGEAPQSCQLAPLLQGALEQSGDPTRFDVQGLVDKSLTLLAPPRAFVAALRAPLRNALQASPADAPIRVEVTVDTNGPSCRIAIVDTGAGMSSEVLQRAGEPFFTTKQPGEGMGLGLFLMKSFFEQIGGSVKVASRVGHGTTVTLTLPLTAGAGASAISVEAIGDGATIAERPPTHSHHSLK